MIMKRKILLLLLLAFCLKGFGQTFTGDVVFFSQAEVVTFGANNYTTIDGNVQIGDPDGSDISDLSSLSTWQTITGNLLIDNTNLITLNGLNSLTSLGDPIIPSDERITLDLQSNTSLTDISALSGITSIGGIDIDFNTSLTSLDGLNNVTETTAVYLRQNNSLLDLSGLENLADIYSLTIENNDNITSLNGLQNLQGPLHFININNS